MKHVHHHDDEHHSHHALPADPGKAFVIGILLNLLFVAVETVAGLWIHSLSLLSDAGHNLADVATLGLSLLAFRLARARPTERFTYGYSKTTILVALLNAVLLLVSIGAIVFEAIRRLQNPQPLSGEAIAWVAGIGIVINATTALMFFREKNKDLNIRSAYLHLLSDAVVSAAIVAGGILITLTGQTWIDPVFSMLIAIVILYTTWGLLSQSLRLSLDAVPADITIDKAREAAEKVGGVKNMHHIHLWAISTTRNALTAHLVVDKNATLEEIEAIKKNVKHVLHDIRIHHATLEVEPENTVHEQEDC